MLQRFERLHARQSRSFHSGSPFFFEFDERLSSFTPFGGGKSIFDLAFPTFFLLARPSPGRFPLGFSRSDASFTCVSRDIAVEGCLVCPSLFRPCRRPSKSRARPNRILSQRRASAHLCSRAAARLGEIAITSGHRSLRAPALNPQRRGFAFARQGHRATRRRALTCPRNRPSPPNGEGPARSICIHRVSPFHTGRYHSGLLCSRSRSFPFLTKCSRSRGSRVFSRIISSVSNPVPTPDLRLLPWPHGAAAPNPAMPIRFSRARPAAYLLPPALDAGR